MTKTRRSGEQPRTDWKIGTVRENCRRGGSTLLVCNGEIPQRRAEQNPKPRLMDVLPYTVAAIVPLKLLVSMKTWMLRTEGVLCHSLIPRGVVCAVQRQCQRGSIPFGQS